MSSQSHHGVGRKSPFQSRAYHSGCSVDEDVVPGGVVGDPVEDDVQPEVVGGVDEVPQVVHACRTRG